MIELYRSGNSVLACTDALEQRLFQAGECLVLPYTPKDWLSFRSSASTPSALSYELAKRDIFAIVAGCEDGVPKVFVADRIVLELSAVEGDAKQLVTKPDFFQVSNGFPLHPFRQYGFVQGFAKLLFAPDARLVQPPKYLKQNEAFYSVFSSILGMDGELRSSKLEDFISAYVSSNDLVLKQLQSRVSLQSAAFHSVYDQLGRKCIDAIHRLKQSEKDCMPSTPAAMKLAKQYARFGSHRDAANDYILCAAATLSADDGRFYELSEICELVHHIGKRTVSSWTGWFLGKLPLSMVSIRQLGSCVSRAIACGSRNNIPLRQLLSCADEAELLCSSSLFDDYTSKFQLTIQKNRQSV